ncbi:MAG: hypothetical protein HONBIEJF_00929 [Fimbriimonadaceae bacterium]|nr:hypothetical protein [Fimbriimonadaceae bacterium]
MQSEAHDYGITSMVILSSEDPLSRQEAIHLSHRGSVIRLLGMMTHSWRTFNAKLFGS